MFWFFEFPDFGIYSHGLPSNSFFNPSCWILRMTTMMQSEMKAAAPKAYKRTRIHGRRLEFHDGVDAFSISTCDFATSSTVVGFCFSTSSWSESFGEEIVNAIIRFQKRILDAKLFAKLLALKILNILLLKFWFFFFARKIFCFFFLLIFTFGLLYDLSFLLDLLPFLYIVSEGGSTGFWRRTLPLY